MKWRLDRGQIEVMDDVLVEVLRQKTPAQRVAMIDAAHRTARHLIAAGVRQQYPDWDESDVATEVIRRLSGGAS
jgi:hypothetical protein